MYVCNARRLTGRGFFLSEPGAAVEIWLEGEPWDAVHAAWRAQLSKLLDAIGFAGVTLREHVRLDGFTTCVPAPIDRLLAVADAIEWAANALAGKAETSFDEAVKAYEAALIEETNAPLLALEAAAHGRGVPFLWDEERVSLGLGPTCEVFEARAIPASVEDVDWQKYQAIPVGMVTGTNGKTTTTRMAARILGATGGTAGHVVGVSSTDAIMIGGEVAVDGDWTGPGAARKVLRNPRVTAAVLETARGGILRRGLAYEQADAAVVTNIGEDHFGDYGITTLEDMARTKAVVWDGVRAGGKKIANASDVVTMTELGLEHVALGKPDWVFFGREAGAAAIAHHVAAGGEAWSVEDGAIVHHQGAGVTSVVMKVAAIPATFDGSALHNVDNALAAAALAFALGADHDAIRAGLGSFGRSPDDNPGRLELHDVDGVRVLLDFGHNPHGVHALAPVVASLRAGTASGTRARLMVATGQAGDRSDRDLTELARAILELEPDRVAVRPMRGYERGRAPGEVETVMRRALRELGLDDAAYVDAADEVAVLEDGIRWAKAGDIVLMLVHIQREEVRAWLAAKAGATP